MRKLPFYKFHGTGNDFILIDNRTGQHFEKEQIQLWCDRHIGVGADGFILIEKDRETDFLMRYFNADGEEASLCGNGSRCATAFAHFLKITGDACTFKAFDGIHRANVIGKDQFIWQVALEMKDISMITKYNDGYFVDTGSPHFVTFKEELQNVSVYEEGKVLRYDSRFPEGVNVNFVIPYRDGILVRTYERGVENETLSCGTGVTASAAIWAFRQLDNGNHAIPVYTPGGNLKVTLKKQEGSFYDITLEGPAKLIFTGEILL